MTINLYPDTIISIDNLSGDISYLSDDTNWYTADDSADDVYLHVGMETPADDLDGEQTIEILVRRTDNSNRDPSMRVILREGSTEIEDFGREDVTSPTGENVIYTFDAGQITNPSEVEFELNGDRSGGPLNDRNTVEIGKVEWQSEQTVAETKLSASAEDTDTSTVLLDRFRTFTTLSRDFDTSSVTITLESGVVHLTWTPSSGEHDGERVYRSTDSSPIFPDNYTEIASLDANTGQYSDTSVPENELVHYAVTAYNQYGESDPLTGSIDTSDEQVFLTAASQDVDSSTSSVSRSREMSVSGIDTDSSEIVLARTRHVSGESVDTDTSTSIQTRSRVILAFSEDTDFSTISVSRSRVLSAIANDTDLIDVIPTRQRSFMSVSSDTDTSTSIQTRSRAILALSEDTDFSTISVSRSREMSAIANDTDLIDVIPTRQRSFMSVSSDTDTVDVSLTFTGLQFLTAVASDIDTTDITVNRQRAVQSVSVDTDTSTAEILRNRELLSDAHDFDTVAAEISLVGFAFLSSHSTDIDSSISVLSRTRGVQSSSVDVDTVLSEILRYRTLVTNVNDTDITDVALARNRDLIVSAYDTDLVPNVLSRNRTLTADSVDYDTVIAQLFALPEIRQAVPVDGIYSIISPTDGTMTFTAGVPGVSSVKSITMPGVYNHEASVHGDFIVTTETMPGEFTEVTKVITGKYVITVESLTGKRVHKANKVKSQIWRMNQ